MKFESAKQIFLPTGAAAPEGMNPWKKMVVGDRGMNTLEKAIIKINRKLVRIGERPMVVRIIREWFQPSLKQALVEVKRYEVEIYGFPAFIEGLKFLGTCTSLGGTNSADLINMAPGLTTDEQKSIDELYRGKKLMCDYCQRGAHRADGFVLRLTKDMKEHFPTKSAGDIVMVGRSCLKKFFPDQAFANLINWAAIIDGIDLEIRGGGDDDEEREGGSGVPKYIGIESASIYIAIAYLFNGRKFVSGKIAAETGTRRTGDVAVDLMLTVDTPKETQRQIDEVKADATEIAKGFMDWAKKFDYKAAANKSPEFASYWLNLDAMIGINTIPLKMINYVASLMAMYVRESDKAREASERQSVSAPIEYLGEIDKRGKYTGTVRIYRRFQSNFGLTHFYIISAQDAAGKTGEMVYYASSQIADEGEIIVFEASVKRHQLGKDGVTKQTVITRAKVKESKGNVKENTNENK